MQWSSAREAVEVVESGARVLIGSGAASPLGLLGALCERARSLTNVELCQILTLGDAPYTAPELAAHVSRIARCVQVDHAIPELPAEPATDTARAIGKHVAGLVRDGDTLQLGIGAIPNAVLSELSGHKDLGIHTEMFSDGVVELFERGVVTCAKKTLHRGKLVTSFVMGSKRVYDFVDDNPALEMHPSHYVNDPFVIAKNRGMVAINSALAVDLTGQVGADSIGHRFYSGVGGQVDFIRGAARAEGGRPIIAMPSTAARGSASRIVLSRASGAGITTTRNDVHFVVTEYGAAELHGKTIRDRVLALTAIAHPDFRESLLRGARDLRWI